MKKFSAIIISFGIIFSLFLFFIDFMAVDSSYYNNFHDKYNISESSGLDRKWIEDASNGLIKYIKNGENKELEPFFNEKEIMHMEDVYGLFKLNRIVYTVLGTFSVFALLVYLFIGKYDIIKYIKKYFLFVYFGIIGLFGVLALFFSSSFVYFHKLFFTNDLWILDYETDLMIRILPENFFLNIFVNIMVLFSISIFLIYIIISKIKIRNVVER